MYTSSNIYFTKMMLCTLLVIRIASFIGDVHRNQKIGRKTSQLIPHSRSRLPNSRSGRIKLIRKDDHHIHADPLALQPQVDAYIGPLFQRDFSEFVGGIAITEMSLQILVGPSEVALGQLGLYISLFSDTETVKNAEMLIPAGTPLCGYGRGYFTDEYQGDKSVGFAFHGFADSFAVFYEKNLVSLESAIHTLFTKNSHLQRSWEEGLETRNDIVYGHVVSRVLRWDEDDKEKQRTPVESLYIQPDPSFPSRIFVPEVNEEDNPYSAPHLGRYANDFAYDPEFHFRQDYITRSETNNILDLAWRLTDGCLDSSSQTDVSESTKDGKQTQTQQKGLMLIPTWPVVKVRSDIRIVNEVPMELGLQYGFTYWDFYHQKNTYQ